MSLKSHFIVFHTGEWLLAPDYFHTSVKLSEKEDHLDIVQTLNRLLHSENLLFAQYFAVQPEDAPPTHLNCKKHWQEIFSIPFNMELDP